MLPTRRAAVDFAKVYSQLALGTETVSGLAAFKKRADEAKKHLVALEAEPTTVDFAHYRSVLKNQKVVDELEGLVSKFQPVTYDVSAQVKAIEAFEAKAVEQAEASAQKVDSELVSLKATLENIAQARPADQLTTTDVINAKPEIQATITEMVKNGKWGVPGYYEKFGSLSVI